ncbi:MAG: hypothetical protein J6Y06_03390, partial [Bacteroidales bacterium]|nr:hypothetical protein [Bacteroidales bacterium]
KLSYSNAGLTAPTGWDINANPWVGVQRTRWMDEIFRTAPYQRHSVTLNVGGEKYKSRLTFSHQNNQGVLINTFNKNLGVRYSGEYEMNNWLKITETMSFSDGSSRGTDTGSAYTGTILAAIYMPQSAEAYASAGPYAGSFGGTVTRRSRLYRQVWWQLRRHSW